MPRLEVFIFDFSRDIYGEWIFVELISKIRAEKKFAGIDELKKQIDQDRETALDFFRRDKTFPEQKS